MCLLVSETGKGKQKAQRNNQFGGYVVEEDERTNKTPASKFSQSHSAEVTRSGVSEGLTE